MSPARHGAARHSASRHARSRGIRGDRGIRGGCGICTQRGIRSDATSGGRLNGQWHATSGGRLNGQWLEGAHELRLRSRHNSPEIREIRGGQQPVDGLRAPHAAPARIPEHGSINEEPSDHENEREGREASCECGLKVSLLKEDLEEHDERRERREGRAQPTNVIGCDKAAVALSVDRDVDLKALIRDAIRDARRAAILRSGGECRGVGGHGNDRHGRAIDGGARHARDGAQMRQQQLQCRELRVH